MGYILVKIKCVEQTCKRLQFNQNICNLKYDSSIQKYGTTFMYDELKWHKHFLSCAKTMTKYKTITLKTNNFKPLTIYTMPRC